MQQRVLWPVPIIPEAVSKQNIDRQTPSIGIMSPAFSWHCKTVRTASNSCCRRQSIHCLRYSLMDQFTSWYYNTVSLSSDCHRQTENCSAPARLRFSILRFTDESIIIINIIICPPPFLLPRRNTVLFYYSYKITSMRRPFTDGATITKTPQQRRMLFERDWWIADGRTSFKTVKMVNGSLIL